jgi:DHA1 family tetracycline resistance protein-like MFS transporter
MPFSGLASPLVFLVTTVFLDAVGVGLILPVMPDLIGEVRGGTVGSAALWGGVLASAYAVVQFLCAPVLGALSDRYGRRPVLLLSRPPWPSTTSSRRWRGRSGFSLPCASWRAPRRRPSRPPTPRVADLTPAERRSQTFGLLSAAVSAALVLGPVLGGLLGELGSRAPFWAAAALAAANLVFGWWALPETVTDATRRPLTWERTVPWGAARAVGRLKGMRALLLVLFLHDLAFMAYAAVWAFWGKAALAGRRRSWACRSRPLGSWRSACRPEASGFTCAGWDEGGTIVLGFAWSAAAFLVFAALPPSPLGGALAFLVCAVSALGEVASPALQGRISRLAPVDVQGEVQGVVASVRSAAVIVGPLLMTSIFSVATAVEGGRLLGAPYLLSALLLGAALVLFQRTRRSEPASA